MIEKTINFQAIDSWFFRETKPMNEGGDGQSIFPPGIRTVAGAIRTWIGEQQNVNWKEYKNDENHPLKTTIGSSKDGDLGQLNFKGVWINKNRKRLYLAPLSLLKKDKKLYQLTLNDKGVWCDLGKNVRLPILPNDAAHGAKPLEKTWISEETYLKLLKGELIDEYDDDSFHTLESMCETESRVGLARDNATRVALKGNLYQAQHIRPHTDVSLEVDILGLPDNCENSSLVRLGGESRGANLTVKNRSSALPDIGSKSIEASNAQGIILYLLSPLEMDSSEYKANQLLPNFSFMKTEECIETKDQTNYWEGEIAGIKLKIHGAIIGKSIRDGGWNMAEGKPRTDKSLIPAGSLFYCEVIANDIANAIKTIHGKQLGKLQQLGYGQLAVGLWKKG